MNEVVVKDINIENLIYEIRGKQVMLDSDLARIYKCANGTKTINQAVNRHINRFPRDFYFQLTKEEYINLKSQIGTSSWDKYGGVRKLPYVFTEQGVAMLATVIRTEFAEEMSISIMRAFVAMRHYVSSSLIEQRIINNIVLENQNDIKKIKNDVRLLQDSFNIFEEKRKINEIYFNGQIYDAYSKILEIFKEAKDSLIIIDSYADNAILDIIKRLNIKVTIITKKDNLLTKQDIDKYSMQYSNLKVIYNNTFHDRYFIIDSNKLYHCGASINRIGYRTFSINEVCDKNILKLLMNSIKDIQRK